MVQPAAAYVRRRRCILGNVCLPNPVTRSESIQMLVVMHTTMSSDTKTEVTLKRNLLCVEVEKENIKM